MIKSLIDPTNDILQSWHNSEKLCMMYSGGLDSLCYIKLFERVGIKIPKISFILKYEDEIINKRNLKHLEISDKIIEFDIKSAIETEAYWNFIKENKCCSPQLAFIFCQQEICRSLGFYPIIGDFFEPVRISDEVHLEIKHKCEYFYKLKSFANFQYSDYNKLVLTETSHLSFNKNNKAKWFWDVHGVEMENVPKYHNFEDNMELDRSFRSEVFSKFQFKDNSTFIKASEIDVSLPINKQQGRLVIRNPISAVHH